MKRYESRIEDIKDIVYSLNRLHEEKGDIYEFGEVIVESLLKFLSPDDIQELSEAMQDYLVEELD